MSLLSCLLFGLTRNRFMKKFVSQSIRICEFGVFYVRNKGRVIPFSSFYSPISSIIRNISSVALHIHPQVVYSDLADKKKTIFSNNRGKSGIYRRVNTVYRSTYIGSGTDLTRIFRDYLVLEWIIKGVKKNQSIIYRALLKYGSKKKIKEFIFILGYINIF